MTDDELRNYLKPKHHWGTTITLAIGIGAAVWAVTSWLNSRADNTDVKALRNDTFQQRLDLETVKGDVKAINVRIDQGFKNTSDKLDEIGNRQRHR